MNPIGTLEDDGRTLVLTRRFTAPIDDVWASVVESDRLERWFGTWTGDPADGWVMVTMNAEAEPVPPTRYAIEACDPPRRLAVSATDDHGTWRLSVELDDSDGTTLTLRQHDLGPGMIQHTGPGWQWYLDRLVAAATGQSPPTLADFEVTYLPLAPAYAALTR